MDHWNEIRTAAHVARLGTISSAAQTLGIHRATVTRHVDLLEQILGRKLFLRHARGFTPTELGLELLRVADATNEQFSQLMRHSDDLSGQLVITSVESLTGEILPFLEEFRHKYPNVHTQLLSSDTVFKLEYGQAHVAFRVGTKPNDPDNVVRPFKAVEVALYASPKYMARHNAPILEQDFDRHIFVGSNSSTAKSPFLKWINENIPKENIGFTSNNISILFNAVLSGIGIGFMPISIARQHNDLIEILPPRAQWAIPSWIVTHVDLHRSRKVQAFLELIKHI